MSALFPGSVLDVLAVSPERPVFECGARTVLRGELLSLVRRLAGAFDELGLGPGRALAIFTAVTPEAFAAHVAAHALGCRVVGVRPGYPAAQLAHVLGLQIDAVLVDGSTLTPDLQQAAGAVRVLSLGPCRAALDVLARRDIDRPLRVSARPDDIALLTFTSGSTGRPKGCAMTYAALSAHWSWQEPGRWSPVACELAAAFERYLLFGTLASMVVLEFLALCLLGGGVAVIPELDGRPIFPWALERYRITGSIITVPRLYQLLELLRTEPADVSSLRGLMVSGSPIAPRRLAAALERLGPVVYQGYGQTEAGSLSMLTPADVARGPARVLRSVGRPHPRVEVSVRNERGEPLAAGESGEIHVRSPYLMARYWSDPDETRDTLRDGWLRTRDLGHVDAQGFLYLTGRTRDVIMVNAMVVYAGPIEQVLARHPDVDQAYVAGAPDDRTGEAVHAFIVPAPERAPDHDALRTLVRGALGADSVPSTITEIRAVPTAASGKPDKNALLALRAP